MQCVKCKAEMTKKGVMQSGNSKYQGWKCPKCHAETSQALGLIGGMPK
jgi:transposase-like protein